MYKTIDIILKDIEENAKKADLIIKTGFPTLDKKYFGITPGETWVVGAYTGTGKTFFMLQMALNIMRQKKSVCYFTLEMNAEPLVARLWGNISGISPTRIEYGFLKPDEFVNKQEAQHDLLNLKEYLYMFDSDREVKKILNSVEDLIKADKKPDIVFLDYIQNIFSESRSEYENLTEAMKTLDTFAKKHDIPFIIASQVSNAGERAGTMEKVIAYKGSGAIAQASDFGLWLNKEVDYDAGTAEIIMNIFIRKVRRGTHGQVDVLHHYPSGRIYEPSKK